MPSLRIAVIGAGAMGRKHMALLAACDAAQLVAICDANPACEALAAEYGIPLYADTAGLLQHETLDGAVIATPTDLHASAAIACAEKGVHVLIEKPIAATVGQGEALLEAARSNATRVLIGHHRRHNPLLQQARRIVRNGDLGQLVAVNAMWTLLKPAHYYDIEWHARRPGGGPVMINLIHDIDNLRFICGEIESVFASTSSATRGLEVEDTVAVNLRFECGALGTLVASDTTASPWSYELASGENADYPSNPETCYHFCGTRGSLAFPRMEQWRYADASAGDWWQPLEKSLVTAAAIEPLAAQIRHFCKVVSGEEAPIISGDDGLATLRRTLAILESAGSNRQISFSVS